MKIAFLDRDGVINSEKNYLYKIQDFEYAKNAIEGMKRIREYGYEIVVVTNQAGIAKNYYSQSDYDVLTSWYRTDLLVKGIDLLDIFHCPHHPNGTVKNYTMVCDCRKPGIGMLLRAHNKYKFNKLESFIVGDKVTDLACGINFGLGNSYLVKTGHEISAADELQYKTFDSLVEIPL